MTEKKVDIQPLLNDYVAWFAKVVQYVFYPGEVQEKPQLSLLSEEGKGRFSVYVDPETLKQIHVLRTTLLKQAEVLIGASVQVKTPDYADYIYFQNLFAELYSRINRLSNDYVVEGFGVDVLTGLRNETVLVADLDVELQKMKRNPYKFCMALIQINDLESFHTAQNKTAFEELLKTLSHILQESIRPYDEVYRLKDSTFLLCLKYTDKLGALNVMQRVRECLEDKKLCFEESIKGNYVNLSSCIMEPSPKNKAENALDNLKQSLKEKTQDGSGIFEYEELSLLEKFVSEKNEVSESEG